VVRVVFSLTWSLPRALSCTPKQLDSGGRAGTVQRPPYRTITLCRPWLQSRWTWTALLHLEEAPQTPHAMRLTGVAVRWLCLSHLPLLGASLLFSFLPLINMLKFERSNDLLVRSSRTEETPVVLGTEESVLNTFLFHR